MDQTTDGGMTKAPTTFCSSCGHEVSTQAVVCVQCGHPLGGAKGSSKVNGLAVAALILGIVWLFWVGSVLAIILGIVALGQIKRSDGAQDGRGLAIAGIVLGSIGVAWFLFAVLLAGAVFFGGTATSSTFSCTATSITEAVNSC